MKKINPGKTQARNNNPKTIRVSRVANLAVLNHPVMVNQATIIHSKTKPRNLALIPKGNRLIRTKDPNLNRVRMSRLIPVTANPAAVKGPVIKPITKGMSVETKRAEATTENKPISKMREGAKVNATRG